MPKILVADDETDLEVLIKQKFRRQIRDSKYNFVFALDGNEALTKLKDNPDVEIVLSDINMPGMDGLSLLGRLNEVSPLIKTVMVSAYGDMENIRSAMNKGAFDFVCKPVNFEDLELTIDKTLRHVQQIKQTLQAIKENNILKMYVDETVLNFMGAKEFETTLLHNDIVNVSVAFVDICGFTAMAEKEPADTVVNMLNNYFDVIVKEILAQGGYIDKFIGDAVMAVFRGDYHLDRAVDASLAVRKSIGQLPKHFGAETTASQVSIGINTGEVVSGNIGSATLKRLDYTVIGDVVNTAQRLQSIAKPGQILLNEDCYNLIKEFFNCTRVGEATLRNKAGKTVVFEVIE